MAITNSKQDWSIGAIVRVYNPRSGFLELRVLSVEEVYDSMPVLHIYTLESLDGRKRYEFTPHSRLCNRSDGLNRIS